MVPRESELNLLVYRCQTGYCATPVRLWLLMRLRSANAGRSYLQSCEEYKVFSSRMVHMRNEWRGEALGEEYRRLVTRLLREFDWIDCHSAEYVKQPAKL